MKLAQRMSLLGTETAFEVLDRARRLEAGGKSIIHLEIGEPDFNTPSNIISAACRALHDGYTHYGPAAGLPELREIIAERVSQTRNIKVKPSNVVVTPGAKPIMFFAVLALIEKGDEVIYPNPGFPIYESIIDFIGAKAVPIKLREENQFRMEVPELKKLVNKKTKLLFLNSPHNPTGSVLSYQDLEDIVEIVLKHKRLFVLSDEIYGRVLYDGMAHSPASFPGMQERTIILDGFSKAYAMTGWRLGYGVMPEKLAQAMAQLMINSNSCTASFSQRAALEALTGPQEEVEKMVAEFKRRRDVIVQELNSISKLSCQIPRGAFYAFPNIKKTGWKSKKLADYLLDEAGVAVLSGTSFGKYGEGFVRISYANSLENIKEGLNRIRKAVEKISK
ncbi:MAG: Aspartate/tyrosine/aromatic aminotransferase [candidate division Zixibacteria bacterium RBG-1]|nr:MAG: Aspartate/tyrosine/aromatic aminotransferase [candidate division Zixibacteria bacterium RBG-1]OGC83649.1 MAG: aspartate aminotransferase [candidate division Zixibacteria bacterium RBG_19FT_COMBO_42_43]